jgi:hypothetical protein
LTILSRGVSPFEVDENKTIPATIRAENHAFTIFGKKIASIGNEENGKRFRDGGKAISKVDLLIYMRKGVTKPDSVLYRPEQNISTPSRRHHFLEKCPSRHPDCA